MPMRIQIKPECQIFKADPDPGSVFCILYFAILLSLFYLPKISKIYLKRKKAFIKAGF